MKKHMILHRNPIITFAAVCAVLCSLEAGAQVTKNIMPLGNSITLGKSNFLDPAQSTADYTTHGYRGYLYGLVHSTIPGHTVNLVGPATGDVLNIGVSPYKGWFQNNAVIADFLDAYGANPAGYRNVIAQLNAMSTYPDIILLHVGTNDIGRIGLQDAPALVGHYNTPGTIMYDIKVLMHQLLEWRGSGGEEIEKVFLCKIIPRAPIAEYPGVNANIQDFNSKLEDLVTEDLQVMYDPDRVTIVDMFAPFYASQSAYYTADNDPVTIDDHIHPSKQGYEAMANQFADYLIDYLSPGIRDEFAYPVGGFNGQDGWMASGTVMVSDVGESPGGALYSTGTGGKWNNVAIWDTTRGLNSASIRIHPNTTNDPAITSGVGILVGMNGTNIADPVTTNRPGGYLVFVHPDGRVDAYIYDGKDVGNEIKAKVGQIGFPTLSPGDIFTVIYEKDDDNNALFMQVNGGSGASITPSIQLLSNANNYYSGIVFRGRDENQTLLVDHFEADNKRLDLVPPDQITLEALDATATNSSVTLQWAAVGDDGGALSERNASSYDLRYSMSRILSEDDFTNANIVSNISPPGAPGSQESITVTGLLSGVTYYFAIKAVDDQGNMSPLSADEPAATTSERTSYEDFTNLARWVYDPDEYGVSNGEIVNKLDDPVDTWGSLAVYKAVKNPKMVKMVWGENVANPTSGLENGGIVIMASDTSIQADGYMIMVRTIYNKIYLFETYWNDGTDSREFTFLDAVPFDRVGLGGLPGKNDTLAVVMDVSETTFTKFDVYATVNGGTLKPASRISLYDTRQENQRPDPDQTHYAGLILTRLAYTRNNNVKAFITTSPSATVSGLIALTPTSGVSGTVNTQLPDSMRVRVEDENGLAVEGVPVFFNVTQGGGSVSSPYTSGGAIRLEAEWGSPVSPMITYTDATASGGEYIASVQHGGDIRGYSTYKFQVSTAGSYYFWGRVSNISYSSSPARYAIGWELVGKDPVGGITWEVLKNEAITGSWQWDAVQLGTSQQPYGHFLDPGTYTIKVITAHRDVRLDKLVITTQHPTTWAPTGKEEADVPISDADGEAAIAWTLGQKADDPATTGLNEGLNVLSAWTFSSLAPINFNAQAVAGQPTQIVKITDNVEAVSGDTVALSVSVFDQFNNKINNQPVNFTIISGDGVLLGGTGQVNTNSNGVASATLRLGAQDTTRVRAQYVVGGPSVTMTVIVKAGVVGSLNADDTDLSKLYVNTNYTDSLIVEVRDNQGSPVHLTLPVQFVVQDNLGTLVNGASATTVWTNLSGIAKATLRTGPRAGIVNVIARTSGKSVTVLSDSVFYVGAHLTKPADHHDRQVLNVNQLAPDYIRVFMSDKNWNGVSGHPVTFQVTDAQSGFTFEDGGSSYIDTTDAYGFARAKVRAGSYHGAKEAYENIVVASASDGFNPVPSPQNFTFFVRSDAYTLAKLTGDVVGVVGEMVGPIQVQLQKANGDPVGNQKITFERITGNGSFNPDTKLARKTVLADAQGKAAVNFWLGTYAGADSNSLRVYTENYNNLISCQFKLTAQSSVGHSLAALSPLSISGMVGGVTNVQVMITDIGGNPVPQEEVTFRILAGKNSTVGNGSADTVKTVMTNGSGVATVAWTLATEAGTNSCRLQATADNGSYILNGSPLVFTASTTAGAVSLSRSTVDATGPIPVGSDSSSTITVTVHDTYGNPVPGKSVHIVVLGGDNNFPPQQTVSTNTAGKAFGILYSTTAGERTIKAVVDGDTLFDSARLIFLAGSAAQLETYSGDNQTGNVNTVLKQPFVVRVTDSDGNPVQYGPVYFNVSGTDGQMVEDMPIVTDANGYARAHFRLGTRIGRYAACQVSSPNLANNPTFWVTGRAGDVYSMWYPTDFHSAEMTGNAGEASPLMIVQVTDADSLPVYGEPVTFHVNPDEGSNGYILNNATVTTDEYGKASVRFRMDTRAGFQSWIYAQNAHQTGKVWFKATSVAGPARRMEAVGSTSLTGKTIGETITLQVRVMDYYGNPINGVLVDFSKILGLAEFSGPSQSLTSNGIASVNVKLGNIAGTVKIQAVAGVEGSPVVFTIETETSEQNASKLVRYPVSDETIAGTVGSYLVDSLYVRVTDQYDNPVANQAVLFRVLTPVNNAYISGNGREYTDSNGIAAVAFMCGTQVGVTHVVEARWGNQTVNIPIHTYYNAHAPVLDKSYIQSVYSGVEEGSDLWIEMRATDADGDNLTYEIGSLFPPDGAFIDHVEGDSRATFKWTPTYEQGRSDPYEVTLRVIDNKGKGDEKDIKIFVQNLNRLPRIDAIEPATTTVSVYTGQTVVFQVFASDPDGDNLSYTWAVDNVPVSGARSAVYHHTISSAASAGNEIVDVFISDGPFTISNRWSVNIATAVQMSYMSARFVESSSAVSVIWRTTQETGQVSFDVYRSTQKDGIYELLTSGITEGDEDGQYVYIDRTVQVGRTYYYKIIDVDENGGRTEHGPVMVVVPAPNTFVLEQNYPNPFNPVTTIRYTLPAREEVTLTVYNMVGQQVATLVSESQAAGFYSVQWDGRDMQGNDLPTGIYIYRLKTKSFSQVRRMVKLQ
ncbi:Ig-like domain-containing protein [bacterium]|nr:Ig-like domain-containing protein [bacterium]